MNQLYSKEIIKHFKNPKNVGKIKNPSGCGEAGNLICGDVIKLYIRVDQEKITDIKFETFGCIIAIANASMLTAMVKGKTLKEVMKIEKEELIKKLGGREKIPPIKIHCSILALDALHEAIYNYYKKNNLPIPKQLEVEHEKIQKTIQEIEKRHKEYLELERKLLKG